MWGLLQHHTHGLKSIYMALLAHGPPFCDPRSEPRASPRSAHDGPLQDRAAVLSAGRRVGIGSRRGDLCTWRGWRTAPVQGLGKEQPAIEDTMSDRARGRARARARRWVNRGWGVVQGSRSRGVARTGEGARGGARARGRWWVPRGGGVVQGPRGGARTGGGVIARAGGVIWIYAGSTAVNPLISL